MKGQFSKVVEIQLRRPDRLRLDVSTSAPKRSFYYDGTSLTVFGRATVFFASAETPATIDETLEVTEEKFRSGVSSRGSFAKQAVWRRSIQSGRGELLRARTHSRRHVPSCGFPE